MTILNQFILDALTKGRGNIFFWSFDSLNSLSSDSRDSIAKGVACRRGPRPYGGLEELFPRALVGGGRCCSVDLAVTANVRTDSPEARQSPNSFYMELC